MLIFHGVPQSFCQFRWGEWLVEIGNFEFLFAVTHSASLASMRGDNATPIEKQQVVSRRSKDVK